MIKSQSSDHSFCHSHTGGFSLIEMAVSLFVLTLVLGSLLVPLVTQTEQRQIRETERTLNEISEALVGYALSKTPSHLPCPDQSDPGGSGIANDGIEDFDSTTGQCLVREGNLPWATLGVARNDPWGNRFRYLVTPAFSSRQTPGNTATMSLTSGGDIKVCSSASALATCAPGIVIANNVPAVVLSHGRNGLGAVSGHTNAANPVPSSADELENIHAPVALGVSATNVVSRVQFNESGSNQFDDILIWISPNVLFSRLVAAGKLP